MEQFIQIVGDFGVAVSMCLGFAFFIYQVFKWNREDSKERELRDRETIQHFSEILATNSKALLLNSEVMDKINGNIEKIGQDVSKLQEDVTEIKIRQEEQHK